MFSLLLLLAASQLVLDGVPEIPPRVDAQVERYLAARSAQLVGWRPEGGVYITTRFGEASQLHHVAQPGGARHQRTFAAEPIREVAVSARGDVLFTRDQGGDEQYQVHLMRGGAIRALTREGRNGGLIWSKDGARFAYYSTARNHKDWDIYVQEPEGAPRRVFEGDGAWMPLDFSFDHQALLILKYVSATQSQLHLIRLNAAPLVVEPVGVAPGVSYDRAAFGPDGSIYLISDEGRPVRTLRARDPQGQARLLTEDIPWDIEELAVSPDGKRLAFTSNEGGLSRLYLLDLPSGARAPLSTPPGVISGLSFSPQGALGYTLDGPLNPADAFSYDPQTQETIRWTFSEVGGLDAARFIAPTLIQYPTFDQDNAGPRQIPAFLYTPPSAQPAPVIVLIHGGPEAQYRPTFSATIQYLVGELGVAVIAPNVRGSAGYGKAWLKLDDGFKREDSVKDIGALLDWIAAHPQLDAKRVAVLGGSYGGYMVLASMIHYGARIAAGVDVVGISNFLTFLNNTKPYRRDLRRVEYGDERDPEMAAFLARISPTARAAEITRPLFIVQGLNDPRVPASEAEQILKAVRGAGGDAWFMLAKDEGHGFRKQANRAAYMKAMIVFFERHLGVEP
ncbi:S9 family peptidase [Myxococcota bacterium]|nr:S9 family peptidase [Myxococcota bacterium]MBU1900686.1 S9 family peptidase [Myxococcota bacterium]